MKTLYATLVATVALAGTAFAQQAPEIVGNYSASVLDQYNGSTGPVVEPQGDGMTFSSQAAIRSERPMQGFNTEVTGFDIHSGR